MAAVPLYGKMAGAVGNYNAHLAAYPDIGWQAVAQRFVAGLGLDWNPYVTQASLHARPGRCLPAWQACSHSMATAAPQGTSAFQSLKEDVSQAIW